MRRDLALLVLVLATTAHADKLEVDATKVDVFRDDTGKLYVLPKPSVATGDEARTLTFYGDGKTMYQQRINTFSRSGTEMSISAWSPRVKNVRYGMIEAKGGSVSLICEMKDRKYTRKPLAAVSADDAAKLFASATFLPPLWQHQVWFFGRGEGGTYYLADVLRPDDGGSGHRLYIGPKGKMKAQSITDVATDSSGRVITTKSGTLVMATAGTTWKVGKKTVTITTLEPETNAYLIYRDLGVYGQLGTICEDQ